MRKFAFLFLFLISACFPKGDPGALVDADYVEAKLSDPTVQIIDLRTPVEVKLSGTIPGAEVKNYFGGGFEEYVKGLDPEREYIIYCKSGGRSAKAAQIMADHGLKVKNYGGGMDDWSSRKGD